MRQSFQTTAYSLCLDESSDVTGSARLVIFTRYGNGSNIKEELISVVSLATSRKGINICNAVVKALTEREIDLSIVVSVTTDGARSMTGEENGFINLFTELIGHSVLGFHCIIHQQVLCAKHGFKSLKDGMILVTKLVNLISARRLLKEVNSEWLYKLMFFTDLCLHLNELNIKLQGISS